MVGVIRTTTTTNIIMMTTDGGGGFELHTKTLGSTLCRRSDPNVNPVEICVESYYIYSSTDL